MTEREYVVRVESRKDADYTDLNNICEAIEARGYQVESNPSSGSIEVFKP